VRERSERGETGALAPPSFTASVIVQALTAGTSGDVWIAHSPGIVPWRYEYPPVWRPGFEPSAGSNAIAKSTIEIDPSILKGQIVLVTGGGHGIGEASCRALAAAGAHVVVTSLQDDTGVAVAREVGGEYHHLDVTRYDEWEHVLSAVVRKHGHLDALHCNAGVLTRPVSHEFLHDNLADWLKPQFYHRIRGVNLDGVAYGVMAALPYFIGQNKGSVLMTSSGAGVKPEPTDPFYSMTKHGEIGLARSLAVDFERYNIKFNVICPGATNTRIIPRDLRMEMAKSGYHISPPSFLGGTIVNALTSGTTGDIWIALSDRTEPWRYTFPPALRDEDKAKMSAKR
jgi:NAD(P)-dependent dehydrogenase (short-subunit alcohol dehydrogenase family)